MFVFEYLCGPRISEIKIVLPIRAITGLLATRRDLIAIVAKRADEML